MIYSTDPEYNYEDEQDQAPDTPPPGEQQLRIWLERKGGGKKVSVVKGFTGSNDDLRTLGKKLRAACSAGGSIKNGEILIQGDQRDKILDFLVSGGYAAKKSGG